MLPDAPQPNLLKCGQNGKGGLKGTYLSGSRVTLNGLIPPKGLGAATLQVPCKDHTSFLFGMCELRDASSPYPASNISAFLALQGCSRVQEMRVLSYHEALPIPICLAERSVGTTTNISTGATGS